ncbi:MAG: BrnT family toxin [Vulcanimicrobiaceae bacterium]
MDDEKSERCFRSRKFDFDHAAKVFEADYIEWEDRRADYGGTRCLTVGDVEGRTLTVVWTPRGTVRRIISARAASRRERETLHGDRETKQ